MLLSVAAACSSAPRSNVVLPARVAMDSAQIERLCARPGLVHVGLAECELKDQSAPIPVTPFDLR
jgi:hypothetical protein